MLVFSQSKAMIDIIRVSNIPTNSLLLPSCISYELTLANPSPLSLYWMAMTSNP